MNGGRISKTAQILGKGLIGNGAFGATPMTGLMMQKKFWIMADQSFGKGGWLNQKEPMVIATMPRMTAIQKSLIMQ